MIIANLYDRRTNLHKEIPEKFEAQFGSVMAPEYTVDSQQIRTVTEEGRTLFDVPDDELLKTGADAKAAFLANAEELYDRLEAAN